MNGGIEQLTENQVIELKAHRYSSTLTALYKQFDTEVESSLRERKDLEPETKFFQNIKWPLVIKLVAVAAVAIAITVTSIINQEWFINTFGWGMAIGLVIIFLLRTSLLLYYYLRTRYWLSLYEVHQPGFGAGQLSCWT